MRNLLHLFLFILLVSIVSGCSCDREKDKPGVITEAPKAKSSMIRPQEFTFMIGKEVPFAIASADSMAVIDSVVFYIGEQVQGFVTNPPFEYFVTTDQQRVGKQLIKAIVYYQDGERDILRTTITLLSDIEPARYTYRLIRKYPHDPQAFTQGLVFDGEHLYEGTGQKGESSLRKVDLNTGKVLQNHYLAGNLFGEGITILDDKIIQLTWKARVGFVYDKDEFAEIGQFSYNSEGWGITTYKDQLLMSDGSATLYILEPNSFKIVDRFEVYNQYGPIEELNELENINGTIYANVFQTEEIAMIDPETGKLIGIIDMSGLSNFNDRSDREDVLNGIAYNSINGHLLVTGKWWPNIYEVELIEVQPPVALTETFDKGI